MSAMGSLMLIQSLLLPACFGHAGNFATHGDFAQLVAAEAELAEHPPGPPGQSAAVAQAHGARIARQPAQLVARLRTILVGGLAVVDGGEQLGASGSEFLHCCAALLVAVDQSGFCHDDLSS